MAREITDVIELELVAAIQEYKSQPLTPELVNKTWQTLWKIWGKRAGHVFDVPTCDRTEKELAGLKEEGRAVVIIPDEIYTPEGLILLGKMFPAMKNALVEGKTIVENGYTGGGCIDVEMSIDSPNRSTNQKDLFSKGRRGQRINTYIIASQFIGLLTGHYLDENAGSRLFGSSIEGYIVNAHFFKNGGLWVDSDLYPQDHDPALGKRSERMKKAA